MGKVIAQLEERLGTQLLLHTTRPQAIEPAGRLRVDMPVLLSLAKQFPRLKLSLLFSDHMIDLIDEGADLMISFGEIGDQSNLVARKLASQRWVICGSPEYLARQGYPDGLHRKRSTNPICQ